MFKKLFPPKSLKNKMCWNFKYQPFIHLCSYKEKYPNEYMHGIDRNMHMHAGENNTTILHGFNYFKMFFVFHTYTHAVSHETACIQFNVVV